MAIPHELTAGETPSVIFGRHAEGLHGNFHRAGLGAVHGTLNRLPLREIT